MDTDCLIDYRIDSDGVASVCAAFAEASDADARTLHDDLLQQGIDRLFVSPRHAHACDILRRNSNFFHLENPGDTGDKRFAVRQLSL